MTWLDRITARKVRALATAAGHDLTRFDAGGDNAIASCKNPGCAVMAQIHGTDWWRFIDLAADVTSVDTSSTDEVPPCGHIGPGRDG